MNWKTWIPLVAAIALALVAAKLTHNVISGKKSNPSEAEGKFVQIVVSRGDLAPGAALTRENLTLAPMPGSVPPPHTYTSVDDLVDRVATQQLVQGQPINEKLLAPKGAGAGLQALVPAGMRAVTIEVNEFTGLSGMVAPNMTVDVMGTFRDETTKDTVTRTVVQNLKVLAVGPRMTPASEEQKEAYKSVTLLANPKEAERVELAAYTGRPRLALRSGRDMVAVATKGASLAQLASGMAEQSASGPSWLSSLLKARPSTQPTQLVEKTTEAPVKPAIDPLADIFAEPPRQQRTVKVIRNGVESSVIFEVPRARRTSELMTDAPTSPVLDGANGK